MALVQTLSAATAKHFVVSNGANSWDRVTITGLWKYAYIYNRHATQIYYATVKTDGTNPADVTAVAMDDSIPIPPNTCVCIAVNESGFGPSDANVVVHILGGAVATMNCSIFVTQVPFIKIN